MPKLPHVSWQQVVRALERLGFQIVHQRGSHIIKGSSNVNYKITTGLLSLSLALGGCGSSPSLTPDQLASVTQQVAATLASEWGLAPGLPREAKLRGWISNVLASPAAIEAATEKPASKPWKQWTEELAADGLPLLSDDVLRAFLSAKARLSTEATNAECAAKMRIDTGRGSPIDADIWRQRLARVSEVDFENLNRTTYEAIVLRAGRRTDPPFRLNETERGLGIQAILDAARKTQGAAEVSFVLATVRRVVTGTQRPESLPPAELCDLARTIYSGAASASGPSAGMALRVLFDPALR